MIQGNQVRLRAIEREDLPTFVRWLNDPEVSRGISLFLPISETDEEAWYENQQKLDPADRSLAIEIQPDPEQEEWVFVGSCGYLQRSWRNRSAEIGLQIGEKKYWNQGFGTRVVELMLKFGFQELNLHRIWLQVFESNPRAIRAYEKAGFQLEGRFRDGFYLEGHYVDVMIMSMLKPEWKGSQNES